MKINKQEAIDYVYELLSQKVNRVSLSKDSIRCKCPYHGGNNPTAFRVHFRKSEPFFNCWSCGANGSVAELVSFLTGKTLKKAASFLVKHTTIGDFSVKGLINKLDKAKEIVDQFNPNNIIVPRRALNDAPMYEYLEKRKKLAHSILMPEYIVNKYGLYYCNHERYAGRIIMPIRIGGETVGYNDRTTVPGNQMKSLHQKNQDFDKLVYGLDEALGKKIGVIVEGAFDVYQLVCFFATRADKYKEYGSVALMCSTISHEKAALIASMFEEAVLMLDHDKAGLKGLKNAWMLEQVMPVRIVTKALPWDKDPGKCSAQEISRYLKYKEPKQESFLDKLAYQHRAVGVTYANQSKNS